MKTMKGIILAGGKATRQKLPASSFCRFITNQ